MKIFGYTTILLTFYRYRYSRLKQKLFSIPHVYSLYVSLYCSAKMPGNVFLFDFSIVLEVSVCSQIRYSDTYCSLHINALRTTSVPV